jgi:drug/metabolite transporter (DMT)-like permease
LTPRLAAGSVVSPGNSRGLVGRQDRQPLEARREPALGARSEAPLPGEASARATNLRAAGLTALAVSFFAVSDAVVKLLAAVHPPGQILFCRGVLACLCLLALIRLRRRGWTLLPLRDRAVWLRSLCDFGASLCFFSALQRLPLAEATAVLFVFPLLLTAIAALVLGERVGAARWAGVAVGLVGVLIILRPGAAAFDPAAVWALAAAILIALRDLVTRKVSASIDTESIALVTMIFSTLASLVTAPFGWHLPDAMGVLGFAASAALSIIGFVAIVAGTRSGDISFTAPFRYVMVPLSFVLGYVIWGRVPDGFVLIGAAVVVLAGLAVLYRRPSAVPVSGRGSSA